MTLATVEACLKIVLHDEITKQFLEWNLMHEIEKNLKFRFYLFYASDDIDDTSKSRGLYPMGLTTTISFLVYMDMDVYQNFKV